MIVEKIRPFTNYIYLHVLGEPLLHPQFDEILQIAETAGLNVNITTNGGLLKQKERIILNHNIRQLNISLHDAEENIPATEWKSYLQTVLNIADKMAKDTYVSLRLWNSSNEASSAFNAYFIQEIASYYNLPETLLSEGLKSKGIRLSEHIFLQHAPRFEWPDINNEPHQTRRNCYALRDHIAILSNGRVVPCCLDANADIELGNIFNSELQEIIENDRAFKIKKGFEQRKVVEPLCATCGFSHLE